MPRVMIALSQVQSVVLAISTMSLRVQTQLAQSVRQLISLRWEIPPVLCVTNLATLVMELQLTVSSATSTMNLLAMGQPVKLVL